MTADELYAEWQNAKQRAESAMGEAGVQRWTERAKHYARLFWRVTQGGVVDTRRKPVRVGNG